MKNILIDAGPLIALFDKSDQYHSKSLDFLKTYEGLLWTTWPVITEVCHMLDFSVVSQLNFLRWIDRGGLHISDIENIDISRIINLTEKFNDVPMDLADASLIVLSEKKEIYEIATIDSDFYIYRDIKNKYLKNIFM